MHRWAKFIFFIHPHPSFSSISTSYARFYLLFCPKFLFSPPCTVQNNPKKSLQTYKIKNNIQTPPTNGIRVTKNPLFVFLQNIFCCLFLFHTNILLILLQTNILIINSMKNKQLIFIICLISLLSAKQPQIIDFTYTHVLQEGGASLGLTDKIIISPDTKQIEKCSFPDICQLKEKLDQGMDQSNTTASSIDVDEHLKELRSKILQLLRLSQQMKNLKAAISQIEQGYETGFEAFNSSHFSEDLKRLADKQLQLAALKGQIEKATLHINKLIQQYNLHPKNQQFNEVNLKYRISFANSKINFYQNLKKSIKNKKATQRPIDYDQFFADLQRHFKSVNNHLNDIDSVINNYSIKKGLQQKIASWNNKIEIDKLLLNQKRECNNSKGKIKNHNHFNQEIKKTFKDLRQKKKEFNGMNNTQCQGVAKKLQEKIRSELKITNRAFICSEGLEEIQQNLKIKEGELANLRRKLEDLKLGELQVYQNGYNKTVHDISKEFQFMKTFSVDEYVHNQGQIDKLLRDAQDSKAKAQAELKGLPDGTQPTFNLKDLQNLVQALKKSKAKYCKQYAEYQHESREIWSKIHKQQKKERQMAHFRSQYISHGQRFLALEQEYKTISNQIVKYLEQRQLNQ